MLDGLTKFATNLGLIGVEGDGAKAPELAKPSSGSTLGLTAVPTAPVLVAGVIAGADPQKVETIKKAVLGSSSVLVAFTAHCETMRRAFPNDDALRMRAALAMMGDSSKDTLSQEMSRTVAAALASLKEGAVTDRAHAREELVAPLERQLAENTAAISTLETEIAERQQRLAEKRASDETIKASISQAEGQLGQQDAVVKASFTEVERYLALLAQSFTQL